MEYYLVIIKVEPAMCRTLPLNKIWTSVKRNIPKEYTSRRKLVAGRGGDGGSSDCTLPTPPAL